MKLQDQRIVLSAKDFDSAFQDPQSFGHLRQALNTAKGQILKTVAAVMNGFLPRGCARLPSEVWETIWSWTQSANRKLGHRLKLKANAKEGEEAILEDDLVTDAFAAAGELSTAIQDVLSQRSSESSLAEKDIIEKIQDFKHKLNILLDLLGDVSSTQDSDLSSKLLRGHYAVKQLCLSGLGQASGVCGQSATHLLLLKKGYGKKGVLTMWNPARRKVTLTVSLSDRRCHDMTALVIKRGGRDQLVTVALGEPEVGSFSFHTASFGFDPDRKEQKGGINAWHAVEVDTSGRCTDVTYHLFRHKDDDGLVSLAIFSDAEGTNVAFFDPGTNAKIGHANLDSNRVKLQAFKDSVAVFFNEDSGMVAVYEFKRKHSILLTKMPISSVFLEGENSYKTADGFLMRAAFDQCESGRLVFFSPGGEFAFYDVRSRQIRVRTRKRLAPSWSQESQQGVLGSHCLARGVLFYIVYESDSCSLKALDLCGKSEVAPYTVCRFMHDTSHYITSENDLKDTNVKLMEQSDAAFVPYAFAGRHSGDVSAYPRRRGASYMWTLHRSRDYRLSYYKGADALHLVGPDNNFVEVRFVSKDSVRIRAKQAAKQREVQAKWRRKASTKSRPRYVTRKSPIIIIVHCSA